MRGRLLLLAGMPNAGHQAKDVWGTYYKYKEEGAKKMTGKEQGREPCCGHAPEKIMLRPRSVGHPSFPPSPLRAGASFRKKKKSRACRRAKRKARADRSVLRVSGGIGTDTFDHLHMLAADPDARSLVFSSALCSCEYGSTHVELDDFRAGWVVMPPVDRLRQARLDFARAGGWPENTEFIARRSHGRLRAPAYWGVSYELVGGRLSGELKHATSRPSVGRGRGACFLGRGVPGYGFTARHAFS